MQGPGLPGPLKIPGGLRGRNIAIWGLSDTMIVMKRGVFGLKNYQYDLPKSLIAQTPARPRDSSRLLVVNRAKQSLKEVVFRDILNFFKKGDVLVLNNTKVIRAKLIGKKSSGARIEVLLLKKRQKGIWEALVKPGKRVRINDTIVFKPGVLEAKVMDKTESGSRILKFKPLAFEGLLAKIGQVPVPHYIKEEVKELDTYQTVYAKHKGAIAAPTAGLHFTKPLLTKLRAKGVKVTYLTLHCGLGTFRPVKTKDIRDHEMASEYIEISKSTVSIIRQAKSQGRRVIAVGTTSVRTLESGIEPWRRDTSLYIRGPYKFKIVDAVITNFHTSASSNLILVSSFAGLGLIKEAYRFAQANNFRFFSFGDAMLIE